jgi:hypothetical protein
MTNERFKKPKTLPVLRDDKDTIEAIDENNMYESVNEAIQELAREGKIYDTGKKRWSERTGSYQIVWAAKTH